MLFAVLASNIPANNGALKVIGNSVIISIVKSAFSSFVMPYVTAFLSSIKHGRSATQSWQGALQDQKTQVGDLRLYTHIIFILEV